MIYVRFAGLVFEGIVLFLLGTFLKQYTSSPVLIVGMWLGLFSLWLRLLAYSSIGEPSNFN